MASDTQTVTALERLMHKGKIIEIGKTIEVAIQDAERLVENGVAEVAGVVKRTAARVKSEVAGD